MGDAVSVSGPLAIHLPGLTLKRTRVCVWQVACDPAKILMSIGNAVKALRPSQKKRVIKLVENSGQLPVSRDAPGYARLLSLLSRICGRRTASESKTGEGAHVIVCLPPRVTRVRSCTQRARHRNRAARAKAGAIVGRKRVVTRRKQRQNHRLHLRHLFASSASCLTYQVAAPRSKM